jgi:hypothetical protein
MIDLNALNLGTFIPTDKVVEVLTGQFTYTYTDAENGGLYEVNNPQPGNLFLPVSIFSIDGGTTWIGDLDGPDFLTCSTANKIRYRWASYGPAGSFTVLYKTALLSTEV